MFVVLGVISYLVASIFIGIGFHKMFVYKSSEILTSTNVNSYVGGDAYNYIINGNYTTAYFVLAGVFVLIGSTMFVIYKINQLGRVHFDDLEEISENEYSYIGDVE